MFICNYFLFGFSVVLFIMYLVLPVYNCGDVKKTAYLQKLNFDIAKKCIDTHKHNLLL